MRSRMLPTLFRKGRVSPMGYWIRDQARKGRHRNQGRIAVRAGGDGVVAADEGAGQMAGANREGLLGIRRPSRGLPAREMSPMAHASLAVLRGSRGQA